MFQVALECGSEKLFVPQWLFIQCSWVTDPWLDCGWRMSQQTVLMEHTFWRVRGEMGIKQTNTASKGSVMEDIKVEGKRA